MFRELKMSVKRGIALGSITGYLFGIMTLFLFDLNNALLVCSIGILIGLVIGAVVIISNTIKLTVYARRKEISIMKYVGATNSFIRWPFIVEGIIIGILAACISILVVGGSYKLIAAKLIEIDTIQKLGITFASVDIVELYNNELLVLEANSGVTIEKAINFIPNGYNIAKEIYKEAIIKMFSN